MYMKIGVSYMQHYLALEFINVVNMTFCSLFMMMIIIYLIENPNLRTKKNLAFGLTFASLSLFFFGNYLYDTIISHVNSDFNGIITWIELITSTSVIICLV